MKTGLGRKTIGEEVQCHSLIIPWFLKSEYKMSMFWPEPEKQKAHWIGASAAAWGMHRHPLAKDDAMYLLWQYRDCCQTVSQ
ncbi:TraU family protein [Endozoicomonas sp. ALB032]|uniref:TraU family protein n=2 Tax=Endozoicomonas TaxID=305899 RepID=UPI003BB5E11B